MNGRPLDVVISAKEAYQAVIEKTDFFRAGVTGPDGFPDPFTGQILMHGNEAAVLKEISTAGQRHDVRPPRAP
ncbi:hypothetical protein [Sorangium cellulosum]|uniref:Uncharacterized protein n=1 Tax=Sorangium cellulosum TaxID=56 RepID=A0A150QXP1_SORCE|nr:hypothetical protein [Sorangium cellulosum]KYF72651.1 hypothetical protein BE15_28515 [Sorangium cellulosum]